MRKPSLLEGCTDWYVATDLKPNFIFPTEIALTTKRPDIVIWSIKAKKVFIVELTVPFEENFEWLDNQCISYRSRMQRFYCQLNLRFLD